MKKEIVYYREQHTFMTQDVTVYVDPIVCEAMLKEDLNDDSKRELFQTYYLSWVKENVNIKGKNTYGSWNAKIADISSVELYLDGIVEKLQGKLDIDSIEKNMKIIDKILGLSLDELKQSKGIKEQIYAIFNKKVVPKLR